MENNKVTLFENKPIRKLWHNEEWYFSVVDVIEALTDSAAPGTYWGMLKKRENQLFTICEKLKFMAPDGKMRPSDCANTEGVLRIIMSIPSPKAEPLKLWLAQIGKREIDELEDPELGIERIRETYKAKGYPDDWIAMRLKSVDTRNELTDEWNKRDVKKGKEYSILTAVIAKGTFGLTPSEHKDLKGLTKPAHNLRDHMTTLELVFTVLGEEITRSMAVDSDAQGFDENHNAAVRGGQSAGKALKRVEKDIKKKVVSPTNFLKQLDGPDK